MVFDGNPLIDSASKQRINAREQEAVRLAQEAIVKVMFPVQEYVAPAPIVAKTKFCRGYCGDVLPVESFPFKDSLRVRRKSWCRDCDNRRKRDFKLS